MPSHCNSALAKCPNLGHVLLLSLALVIAGSSPLTCAFVTSNRPSFSNRRTTTTNGSNKNLLAPSAAALKASKNKSEDTMPSPSAKAEFEWQEMRVQLDAIKSSGLDVGNINAATQNALEKYVRQVLMKRSSPVTMNQVAEHLSTPPRKWRLVWTTDETTLSSLPPDATVYLEFFDDLYLDYVLQFSSKTFGLDDITAQSSWSCTNDGQVSWVYDKISTRAFGKDIGLSSVMVGWLQGRTSRLATAYLDDQYWIERGLGSTGEEYFSVYVREKEE